MPQLPTDPGCTAKRTHNERWMHHLRYNVMLLRGTPSKLPGRARTAATSPSQPHLRSTRGCHGLVTTNMPSSQLNTRSTAQLPVIKVAASRCCVNLFASCSDALLLSAATVLHAEFAQPGWSGEQDVHAFVHNCKVGAIVRQKTPADWPCCLRNGIHREHRTAPQCSRVL